jgi:hypothetical protein
LVFGRDDEVPRDTRLLIRHLEPACVDGIATAPSAFALSLPGSTL